MRHPILPLLTLAALTLSITACKVDDFPPPSTTEKTINVAFGSWLGLCSESLEDNETIDLQFVVNGIDINDPSVTSLFSMTNIRMTNSIIDEFRSFDIKVPLSGSAQVIVTANMSCSSCCGGPSSDPHAYCPAAEAGTPYFYADAVIPMTQNIYSLRARDLLPKHLGCRDCGHCLD